MSLGCAFEAQLIEKIARITLTFVLTVLMATQLPETKGKNLELRLLRLRVIAAAWRKHNLGMSGLDFKHNGFLDPFKIGRLCGGEIIPRIKPDQFMADVFPLLVQRIVMYSRF
jgi:hypothetical protein